MLAFLGTAGDLESAARPVQRRDTHASVVFLTPERAYKLKRAVRYDYLDYSTPEKRRQACEAELAVNRRTAPDMYLGVAPVTRQADGSIALAGPGSPMDWVVVMRRFDDRLLLDALAERGALPLASMAPLGEAIRALHDAAERTPREGGRAGMSWVIDGNEREFAVLTDVLNGNDPRTHPSLYGRLHDHDARLEARRAGGWVRRCHGDLHLGNVVWLDGGRCCSTPSSSTTRWPASTSGTTWPSC